jgi:hypothetical protein
MRLALTVFASLLILLLYADIAVAQVCNYIIGDVNGSGQFNGLDVTYSVNFFKYGYPVPPYSCDCPRHGTWFVTGDVNGSCAFNGVDVTFMINYLHRGEVISSCPDCPSRPPWFRKPPGESNQAKQ